MRVPSAKHFMIIKHEEGQEETLGKSAKGLRKEGPTIWESCASRFSPFQCFFKSCFFRLWAVSYFSLQSYCTQNLSMRAAIKEAIALAEIRARPILRKKRQTASSLLFFHTTCKALCQQLPTLLDVTRCICFHTLLHVVVCCWELLHKVETDQTLSYMQTDATLLGVIVPVCMWLKENNVRKASSVHWR